MDQFKINQIHPILIEKISRNELHYRQFQIPISLIHTMLNINELFMHAQLKKMRAIQKS